MYRKNGDSDQRTTLSIDKIKAGLLSNAGVMPNVAVLLQHRKYASEVLSTTVTSNGCCQLNLELMFLICRNKFHSSQRLHKLRTPTVVCLSVRLELEVIPGTNRPSLYGM